MSSVGENIKLLRTSRSLSREKLARKIGMTAHGLYQLERGLRKVSLDWLNKIAEALNCNKTQLLGEETMTTNKLKEIRELRGYTQDELGEKIGMTGVSVSLLERDKRNLMAETLDKLSKALNCSMAQLLGEEPINKKEEQQKMVVVSNNEYPLKDKYIEYAVEIADKVIDHSLYSRKEKAHFLSEIYKLVYDFFENGTDKEEFERKMKNNITVSQGILDFIKQIGSSSETSNPTNENNNSKSKKPEKG